MTQSSPTSSVLDSQQLERIEAVHRGFLFQHLYAVACLFLASGAGATDIIVERDEDVEIVLPGRRLYVQVKTRREPLVYSDIEGAVLRFDALRKEHDSGARKGGASFFIATNAELSPSLSKRLAEKTWPSDVAVQWPGGPAVTEAALPGQWRNLGEAFAACCDLARTLPFALLAPETLVWKLAGRVMSASAGIEPHTDHTFKVAVLSEAFEQLVIQLQDFPAPPVRYRPQDHEPELVSDQRIRLIVGFSGAGKTSWVSQSALHTSDALAYFNVSEVPSTALVSSVARELAARLFGKAGVQLGEILLPGITGPQILFAIGRRLAADHVRATVVIDNAHRISDTDIRALIEPSPHLHFILLAQPGPAIAALEATLGISAEPLRGWTNETVAAEGAALGCHGDYAAYDKIIKLTGGLPLYAQNALQIAAVGYEGGVARFCRELEQQTHTVSTAQELILARIFDAYGEGDKRAVGALSLVDIPISQAEAVAVLSSSCHLDDRGVAALFRKLRLAGILQVFGVDRFKVHDAMRLLGRAHLESLGSDALLVVQRAIKDILLTQLPKHRSPERVSLLLRMFVAINEVKPLVQMATDEIFHELGYMTEITAFLERFAASEEVSAEDRFWALDGLVFAQFKKGDRELLNDRLTLMERLVADHDLGASERLAVSMKRMNFLAQQGDVAGAQAAMDTVMAALPDRPEYLRIARYNYARALFSLGAYRLCLEITGQLISEYYTLLGLTPAQVIGNNPDKIFPLLKQSEDLTDDLKHLADTLDLQAMATNRLGSPSRLERIHAMKFYSMAHALDSYVRVGQDLVDEFVERADYIGALDVFERNLLPTILRMKMASHIIPVRSQYAVVLAYSGRFEAAEAEMARLAPYESGLTEEGRTEMQRQRRHIARMRLEAPPPQWQIPHPRKKYPVNAACFCGSGKKYKKCHGRRT
ncbi:SEC-C metal-binding domain-containing protein [Bradyrhizobium sp.]|jgi:hypothetical protein|uniref:SEC-C metal-binding domain-containing protein n=1 Tax=Bradyrhizobium sp. TaxID=376 RepID=UPI002DDD229F|nr:SEC-C metal-binding domain-containing protein [Bradyrhizobium sp.]HEV2160445.1 SEC-C metal-binding domain-containing protein [Bradyrhizobium sp.]